MNNNSNNLPKVTELGDGLYFNARSVCSVMLSTIYFMDF